jgi:DNA transformation protein
VSRTARAAAATAATAAPVATLPGLGPKSAAALARLGVHTPEALRGADAVALYLRLKALDPRTSLNMLYGLLAAQEGRPWQAIARERRTELLLRLDALGQAPGTAGRPRPPPMPPRTRRPRGP